MSATILQFPTKAVHVAITTACIDILPVDKRGFVILDACVPAHLALSFSRLFRDYAYRAVEPVQHGVEAYPDSEYSFNLVQHEIGGSVLIEACIPLAMATAFHELAIQEQTAA